METCDVRIPRKDEFDLSSYVPYYSGLLIALDKETDTEPATPLVAVDPLDLGILFTSLQITFTADGSLPFNEIFVKLLDNTLDFITITHVLKIDSKPIYDEARYVQARLITIEKFLTNFKNIL